MKREDDRASGLDRIKALLQQGAPWEASDVFRETVLAFPEDAELLYWGALAHARSGAANQARALLDRAQTSGSLPPPLLHEALCLNGRLWKDRIDHGSDRALDAGFIERAREEYLKAYALSKDSYPGANAATLSMLLGERDVARALATELIGRLASAPPPSTSWQHAAWGEALLLLDDLPGSRQHYLEACALEAGNAGSIASMRRQLKLLQRVLPRVDEILAVLPTANVLAFSGHMVDRADQGTPRFPADLEPIVAAALRDKLRELHRPIVYTSAACGADLLFIEAALECGAEVNIVLPFDRDDFVRTSVAVGGAHWVERFDHALLRAARVVLATEESHLGDDVLFEHAVFLVEGLAILRASQLQTTAALLCVLDADSASQVGGTRAAYDRWSQLRGEPDVIDLRALRHDARLPGDDTPPAAAGMPTTIDAIPIATRPQRTIKAMLFADISGFGRLHDAHAPLFHAHFLRLVAEQIAACATPPLEANTWGDALYVVFESSEDGADFALGLLARARTIDWTAAGLSETSQIRVALHAGPVFRGFDPIMGRDNYFGSNVTKAARIEPVTPPGLVYASEAFVATLASVRPDDYAFEYIGNLQLAKGYGESRIYRLERW